MVFPDVTFFPKIGPVETERIGLQFDEYRACQTMRSGTVQKGTFWCKIGRNGSNLSQVPLIFVKSGFQSI
jgi:hypothetical protein